jgi:transposase-like protein
MFKDMSLLEKKEFISQMTEENNKVTKIEGHRTTFLQLVTEWGYKTPMDFLIEAEFIPNPSVKKPRVKITDEVRQKVVTDIKSGVSTKEISLKYGVTEDSVYNIKGKSGLTKQRTKTVPSPSVTVQVTPPTVTQPTAVRSVEPLDEEFARLCGVSEPSAVPSTTVETNRTTSVTESFFEEPSHGE